MEIGGGLTKEAVAKATSERSEDFTKWVLTTDEIRAYPFDQDVRSLARSLLDKAGEGLSAVDKEAVKTHDPAALGHVAGSLGEVARHGDELVRAAGSLRAALAAVLVTSGTAQHTRFE